MSLFNNLTFSSDILQTLVSLLTSYLTVYCSLFHWIPNIAENDILIVSYLDLFMI